ncbi:MAG TPA: PQQ-dependent sugar dehydrogenase [Planctomycetota bacterium]|nr:PQQ-dependent sugar dehydrogenase [Planctomycetota bacterium]
MRRLVLLMLSASIAMAGDIPDIRFEPVWPQLTFERPLAVVPAGDGSQRLFVVEQAGRIWVVPAKRDAERSLALDLRAKVLSKGSEEGLLALAFHPRHAENRQLFIYYSAADPRRVVLSRLTIDAKDPARVAPDSEEVLLEIGQPYENHNGSSLVFGPDGMLYLSPGDGGSGGDPHDAGQRLDTLLGKILRIDVDRADPGRAYAIPPDNPFVGTADARGEIWAYGLRNVWRMTFDRETGDLWAGDVGQNSYEEIDLIVRGGNYGWRVREGKHLFKDQPYTGELIEPIVEYGRDLGVSVTGGYVYRGKRFPALQGVYLYADFATGRTWGLRYADKRLIEHRLVCESKLQISSFGETADGELMITAFDGRVYAVVAKR